ncbi:MAG TPA: hypothetical protein VM755_09775 [Stellaceae bacterium]|nr:hypothetical protein [Stellaceae bacterium]
MDLKYVVIAAVVIAAIATLIGVVGQFVIDYWPLVLIVIAVIVGGIVYWKRQKRVRDTV